MEIPLVRPADLLSAVLSLDNLTLNENGTQLVRADSSAPATLQLRLPAQHYLEPVGTQWLGPVRAGGESFISFEVPDDAALLDLPPGGLFELLARLPTVGGHSYVEFPAGLRTFPGEEFWEEVPQAGVMPAHTVWRLRPRSLQAVTNLPLQWYGQYEVDATVGTIVPSPEQWRRMHFRSFRATRYALSSLGGTIHLSGPVPLPDGPPDDPLVDSYQHHATFGRDTWVQVTTRGRLSTGHRASLVQTVTRTFSVEGGEEAPTRAEAGLREQRRIVVTEPEVDVSAWSAGYRYEGREMPFRRMRMITHSIEADDAGESNPFWIKHGGNDVLFTIQADDWDGRRVTLSTPAMFIPDILIDPGSVSWTYYDPDRTHWVDLGGQTVAMAESSTRRGATSVVVQSVALDLNESLAEGMPAFLPCVALANVVLEAVQQFTGKPTSTVVSLHPAYLQDGLGSSSNPAGAFLDFTPVALEFAAASVGGLANLKSSLGAVNIEHGAVAGELALGGELSVDAMKDALRGTKILGVVDLIDLLPPNGLTAPTLSSQRLADSISLEYHYSTSLKTDAPKILRPGPGAMLTLEAKVVRALDPAATVKTTVKGTLTDISIEIAGIAVLSFTSLTFITEPGQKTRIEPAGMDLHFQGALGFVAEIARSLASSGLGKAATVDVGPNGVSAGFAIAIPSIQMGVVQLANLSIGASLVVPFDGTPFRFRLDIASRARPFVATVSMFGGGGYFSMELTSEGLRRLEVSIEFGGSMSLDIIVASGGVYVMAGIYFSYKTVIESSGRTHEELVVSAYLRCGGHVSVLGIISVSVEFYLELTYKKIGNQDGLAGRATVTVGIEVLFFSKTVELTVEREFVGSAADPSFAECITPEDWEEYCQAFVGTDEPQPALP